MKNLFRNKKKQPLIKLPQNHPKTNFIKPNVNHPLQVGHAKTSFKNPKTALRNL